jgi:hypothetical protein
MAFAWYGDPAQLHSPRVGLISVDGQGDLGARYVPCDLAVLGYSDDDVTVHDHVVDDDPLVSCARGVAETPYLPANQQVSIGGCDLIRNGGARKLLRGQHR